MQHSELFDKIHKLIETEVRPYLNSHGGDIELVELDKENRLHVSLRGACGACPGATMTLQYVVQEAISEAFPDDKITVVQAGATPCSSQENNKDEK